ncbi:MAG: DegT/DnrJ/EryC1/StrS family aminotransferase [Candidatus Hydrogenedentota bacterium]
MRVPFVDLTAQHARIRGEIDLALDSVIQSSAFVLGPEVKTFEDNFAAFCGVKHCVGVASGADALHLTLRALGIGPGDEVITAANTFIATVNAIALSGATPVLVDVREDDYNLDPALLERAITSKTKAILPVHLYGQPAEMDAIQEVARRHELFIVEDACQAHGATYRGRPVGSLSDAACFSFYPGKNLGALGEGGAVVMNDESLAAKLRVLRDVGQSKKYVHPVVGFNSRLHTIQAAVLDVKLKYLREWNTKRQWAAERYRHHLADADVVLPREHPHAEHVWHLYVVQHDDRDGLIAALREEDVFCGIHYPVPVHEQEAYPGIRTVPEGAPVSSRLARRVLSLPMHPELTEEQIAFVAGVIRRYRAGREMACGPRESRG